MPSGRPNIISPVIDLIMRINPDSILDVGSGFGKWGFLLREYLEVWQGRLYPEDWKKRIDAIEIFKGYTRLPWYAIIYNNIYTQDITKNDGILANYDLVLFMDVVEHLEKEKGLEMLKKARHWIVSTPNYVSGQGAKFGNEYEAHISEWAQNDFKKSVIIGGRWIIGYQSCPKKVKMQ